MSRSNTARSESSVSQSQDAFAVIDELLDLEAPTRRLAALTLADVAAGRAADDEDRTVQIGAAQNKALLERVFGDVEADESTVIAPAGSHLRLVANTNDASPVTARSPELPKLPEPVLDPVIETAVAKPVSKPPSIPPYATVTPSTVFPASGFRARMTPEVARGAREVRNRRREMRARRQTQLLVAGIWLTAIALVGALAFIAMP